MQPRQEGVTWTRGQCRDPRGGPLRFGRGRSAAASACRSDAGIDEANAAYVDAARTMPTMLAHEKGAVDGALLRNRYFQASSCT